MGIIKLGNMSSVGAVPPDGAYPVTIVKVDAKESQDKQSTNLFLTLHIDDAPEAPEWVDKEITHLVNVQESTLWRVQQFLEAATGQDWKDDEMDLDPDDLIGRSLIVEGVEGEYKGQKQFNIKNYYPADYDPSEISD